LDRRGGGGDELEDLDEEEFKKGGLGDGEGGGGGVDEVNDGTCFTS
jgi:hypothetical protein